MKTKKMNKVLMLNKRTMANLDGKSLSGVFGGVDPTEACITRNDYSICPRLCPETTYTQYETCVE